MHRIAAFGSTCAVVTVMAMSSPASAAVNFSSLSLFNSGLVYATADEQAEDYDYDNEAGYETASTLAEASPLVARSTSVAFVSLPGSPAPMAYAEDDEELTTLLTSAEAGSFVFSGHATAYVANAPTGDVGAFGDGGQWTYEFTATTESEVYLSDFDPDGSSAVDYVVYIQDNSTGRTLLRTDFLSSSGDAISTKISPGESLSLVVVTNYNPIEITEYGGGQATASYLDTFNFNISTALPEPAAWSLMLVGFGSLGGAVRASRRREARVTA